jgi:hypothetical protein
MLRWCDDYFLPFETKWRQEENNGTKSKQLSLLYRTKLRKQRRKEDCEESVGEGYSGGKTSLSV